MSVNRVERAVWRRWTVLAVCFCVWVALGLLTGCASLSSSKSASHAAITLTGYDVTDVALTTRDVFVAHGYRLAAAQPDRITFERPGTRSEQIKYGSFGSPDVVIRVKVDIQEMGPESCFLRCDVFSVRDAGSSVLEDETRLMLVSAKPYQEMLDEVKTRLQEAALTGSAP